ncbi:MAG: hypothetical protein HY053_06265 [Proteobacteria bacterium]|nr:hypothetical protein [Pseudomonadota bacterium]
MQDSIGPALTSPFTRAQLDAYRAEVAAAEKAALDMQDGRAVDPKYKPYSPDLILANVNAEKAGFQLVEKGLEIVRGANVISISIDNANLGISATNNDLASQRLVREVVDQASLSGGKVLSKVFGLAQAELGFVVTETTRPGAKARTFQLKKQNG